MRANPDPWTRPVRPFRHAPQVATLAILATWQPRCISGQVSLIRRGFSRWSCFAGGSPKPGSLGVVGDERCPDGHVSGIRESGHAGAGEVWNPHLGPSGRPHGPPVFRYRLRRRGILRQAQEDVGWRKSGVHVGRPVGAGSTIRGILTAGDIDRADGGCRDGD
jgi:hypothetical protein